MSEKRSFGWKRAWSAPRAAIKGGTLWELTPRGKWLTNYSRLRAMDNPDIVISAPMPMEFGIVEGFRFIRG